MAIAQRTLVKSPPELWAEISDGTSLARHLDPFGEVRITRLEPETTVAWEGDRTRGTVQLEPSGWGTRVTLAAESIGAPETPVADEGSVAVLAPVPEEPAADVSGAEGAPDAPDGTHRRWWQLLRRRPRSAAPPPAGASTAIHAPQSGAEITLDEMGGEPAAVADPEAILVGVLDELGSASRRPSLN